MDKEYKKIIARFRMRMKKTGTMEEEEYWRGYINGYKLAVRKFTKDNKNKLNKE